MKDYVAVWVMVLLISGQGFRYLLGLPVYAAVVIATIVAVGVAYRPSSRTLVPPLLIGTFAGIAILTIAWSATRMVTLLAVAVLLALTFMALTIVRETTVATFMGQLYRGFQISLFLGIAFEMVVAFVIRRPVEPLSNDLLSLAGENYQGSTVWSENNLLQGGYLQGFVGNRNPFGTIALMALICAAILYLDRRIGLIDTAMTGVAGIAVLYLTQSATVAVALIYTLGLGAAGLIIRRTSRGWKRPLSFVVLGFTAAAGILTLKYHRVIFALFDRSADATNRGDIWSAMLPFALQRPEGWGYVAFWPVSQEPYVTIVENSGGFWAAHGHNAYLDAWLQVGILGAVVLVTIVVLTYLDAWRLVERGHRGESFIPLGWALLTAVLALQGLTESRMLSEWGWFLLVALYCSAPGALTLTLISEETVRTGDRTPSGDRA